MGYLLWYYEIEAIQRALIKSGISDRAGTKVLVTGEWDEATSHAVNWARYYFESLTEEQKGDFIEPLLKIGRPYKSVSNVLDFVANYKEPTQQEIDEIFISVKKVSRLR